MQPLIQVEKITFAYGRTAILSDITFAVEPGEILGIIGPNGSGKTTLLRLLTGILQAQSGTILISGKEIALWTRNELAKRIAVVPQDTFVPFNYTVREIVLMGRTPHLRLLQFESSKDVAILNQAMALTDTLEVSERYFDALSGGEKQRALIARALVQEPTILLLDEPTAHLDLNHQIEILDLVKRLNVEENLTVIFVTHDINLAAGYCHRLILLFDGTIFCSGSPQEVITEENIRQVYGTNVVVSEHPLTGVPQVNLLSWSPFERYEPKTTKVHVIGGGGASASLLRRLAIEGYPVTVGVLNIGDTDELVANSLHLEVVREQPFSPISDQAMNRCRNLIDRTDCVILARIMVGNGNLANLALALYAAEQKKRLFVIEPQDPFDFTGGKAKSFYERIYQHGAIRIKHTEEILEYLAQYQTEGKQD
ncbi:MAG: heme ABC transporter ATP-binding protein [bacterium]|nr:heme ABC transporter ATP-binding protein [bacterium]